MITEIGWIAVTTMLATAPDPNYERAISEARHAPGADRRGELSACMTYIDKFGEHARLWQAIKQQELWKRHGFALLETTGSMWGGYTHALHVDGVVVRGLEAENEQLVKEALAPFEELRRVEEAPELATGSADSEVLDGACYFLTVNTREHGFKQIAIYGEPDEGTAIGRLLKTLVKVASTVDLRKKLVDEGPSRPGRAVPTR